MESVVLKIQDIQAKPQVMVIHPPKTISLDLEAGSFIEPIQLDLPFMENTNG